MQFCFAECLLEPCGPGSVVGIATGYGLDRPGIESPWGEIFRICPDRPWGPPSLLYNGYRVFRGVKSGRGVTLTLHPLLVPWSWKGKAIPLLPLWAARPVQSLSACTRVHVIFLCLSQEGSCRRWAGFSSDKYTNNNNKISQNQKLKS
jgi:hypothetical protein